MLFPEECLQFIYTQAYTVHEQIHQLRLAGLQHQHCRALPNACCVSQLQMGRPSTGQHQDRHIGRLQGQLIVRKSNLRPWVLQRRTVLFWCP